MSIELGVAGAAAGMPLGRRLAWLTAVRLVFLAVLLGLVGLVFGHSSLGPDGFTPQAALLTLAVAFAQAGVYAAVLSAKRALVTLARTQLVLDQLTWTVVAYLTGGAASGATSLYGLTCLAGATLLGRQGAALAAVAAASFHVLLLTALFLGWVTPPSDQIAAIYRFSDTEFFYNVLLNCLMLAVVTLLAGYLAERLRLTGGQLAQAEQRAEQAERLAALGRLATGLAHEIRNPLGSIAGSVQLLKAGSSLNDEERQLCDIIQRETERLNDLVSDMTDLARPRKPQPSRVNAAAITKELVQLASRSGRAASDVFVTYSGAERAVVSADPAQLRQMIWNLLRNAIQASAPGDRVHVQVEIMGGEARLVVEDHGVGIDEQAKLRLFDAFFTTRSKGTGVGLAVVKRIVDEHRFTIDVSSEHGQGAVFAVSMGPLCETESVNPPGGVSSPFSVRSPKLSRRSL
ncbi:PAS domain-containing sensor histidine kinase [Myxococcota bacterium]